VAKLRCYKCDGILQTGDNFMFVGTLPIHRNACPVKLTVKQTEYLLRFRKGDYGVPLDTPDASMWRWNSDKTRMNSSVVHSLWDKKLIDQTYTEDARMLLTEDGKRVAHGLIEQLVSSQIRATYSRSSRSAICICPKPDPQQVSNSGPDLCRKCGRSIRSAHA
jgi:hypothetical protein